MVSLGIVIGQKLEFIRFINEVIKAMDSEKRIEELEKKLHSSSEKINRLESKFSKLVQVIEKKLGINIVELRLTEEAEKFIDDFLEDE